MRIAPAIIALLSWGLLPAATIYVDDNTCPATGAGTLASPYCHIQSAICFAVSGDLVSVAPGTYPEALRMRPNESAPVAVATYFPPVPRSQSRGAVKERSSTRRRGSKELDRGVTSPRTAARADKRIAADFIFL